MKKGRYEQMFIMISGEPVPAARPRFGGGHAYQPKRNAEYRQRIQTAARAAMKGSAPMTGAIEANVKLFRRFKPTARNYGDVDNHAKALFDGMNQIVFDDDRQIVRCVVEKFQDKLNPRVEVTIQKITDDNQKGDV